MTSKLRTYAEDVLGVHKVHEEAKAANGEQIDLNVALAGVKADRRRITEEIADREVEIWREARDRQPELSATALDAKSKHERRTDPTMQFLRQSLLEFQKREDDLEHKIRSCQNRISIASARMIQLGGYIPMLVKIMEDEAVAQANTP